jgi:hypothetical protein
VSQRFHLLCVDTRSTLLDQWSGEVLKTLYLQSIPMMFLTSSLRAQSPSACLLFYHTPLMSLSHSACRPICSLLPDAQLPDDQMPGFQRIAGTSSHQGQSWPPLLATEPLRPKGLQPSIIQAFRDRRLMCSQLHVCIAACALSTVRV